MESKVLKDEELAKAKKLEQEQALKDFKIVIDRVFKSDDGQYILKWFALNSGFFAQDVNIQNENVLFYQQGKKKAFMDIFYQLDNECKKKLIDNLFVTK